MPQSVKRLALSPQVRLNAKQSVHSRLRKAVGEIAVKGEETRLF